MNIGKIVTMMMILVGMYLVIANGDKSAKIIESIASNSTKGIKALQGRD